MDQVWHDGEARARFAEDRRLLLEQHAERFRLAGPTRPSDALPDVFRMLGFSLVRRELAAEHLAQVDFQSREVVVTTDPGARVKEGTDVAGLVNANLAHELAHIRLHEEELAARGVHITFAEAAPRRPIARIEAEADCYAAVFLVPSSALAAHPALQPIVEAQTRGHDLDQEAFWRLIGAMARHFAVTPTLLKNQLVALGYCTYDRRGREVHVAQRKTARSRGAVVPS